MWGVCRKARCTGSCRTLNGTYAGSCTLLIKLPFVAKTEHSLVIPIISKYWLLHGVRSGMTRTLHDNGKVSALSATKLDKEDGPVQVSTLVYALGKEAENIQSSFTNGAGEGKSQYNVVTAKFDAYFFPRRNVIHEHAFVLTREHSALESVQRHLTTHCMNCQGTHQGQILSWHPG